jgi:DNA polymerase-3 subunit gamma/tau
LSYLVLARKWRPQNFQDLIGQEHVSQTLKNAIDTDRVAHAFLFTGARGVGKTSAARIFAKALNCIHGPTATPCNVCPACLEITNGTSVDVFEIDGASNNGVDEVRELRENIKYLPSSSRYKLFIIDEVHMLSNSAFNALLKTLEEPPPHVKFIFATTEPHKVPITILSRCQRFDFKRIPLPQLLERLRYIIDQEQVAMSTEALMLVARKGDGSMRDALSTLDQVLAFCGMTVADDDVRQLLGVVDHRLVQDIVAAIQAQDAKSALDVIRQVDAFGYNPRQFAQEVLQHLRNLLLLRAAGSGVDLGELSDGEIAVIQDQAARSPLADLQRFVAILLKAEAEMAQATFPRLVLELAVVRMAHLLPLLAVDELLARLPQLAGGSAPVPHRSAAPPERRPASHRPASEPAPAPAPVRPVAVEPAAQPSSPPPAAAGAPSAPSNRAGGVGDLWPDFVASVRSSKPLLAVVLEKARPFRVDAAVIEIGYAAGAFELSRLREGSVLNDLRGLAASFFGQQPEVVVREVRPNDAVAPSLQEKKTHDEQERTRVLREAATQHPVINEALKIFGGELREVREPDGSV